MFNYTSHRNIFFSVSIALVTVSILSLIFFGLKPGIDFIGGTMMEIGYETGTPTNQEIKDKLAQFNLKELSVQSSSEKSFILRFSIESSSEISNEGGVDETVHQNILESLGNPEEIRFESIGPTIGRELAKNAKWSVFLSLIAITVYIVLAFKKLGKIFGHGESWRYGAGALIALAHDVIIMLGFFSLLGHFKGVEINSAFITAILIVMGYSVNDTIVVYDRIRENLLTYRFKELNQVISVSVTETIVRSLNTSLTTIFALLAIYLFGGESIRNFSLAMIVGIGIGTWSSIVIASNFLLLGRKKEVGK